MFTSTLNPFVFVPHSIKMHAFPAVVLIVALFARGQGQVSTPSNPSEASGDYGKDMTDCELPSENNDECIFLDDDTSPYYFLCNVTVAQRAAFFDLQNNGSLTQTQIQAATATWAQKNEIAVCTKSILLRIQDQVQKWQSRQALSATLYNQNITNALSAVPSAWAQLVAIRTNSTLTGDQTANAVENST